MNSRQGDLRGAVLTDAGDATLPCFPMPGAEDERRGGYLRVVRVKLLHSQLPSTIAASLTAAAVAATLLYSLDPGLPLGQ